jgi:hypothetical protein
MSAIRKAHRLDAPGLCASSCGPLYPAMIVGVGYGRSLRWQVWQGVSGYKSPSMSHRRAVAWAKMLKRSYDNPAMVGYQWQHVASNFDPPVQS